MKKLSRSEVSALGGAALTLEQRTFHRWPALASTAGRMGGIASGKARRKKKREAELSMGPPVVRARRATRSA